MKVQKNIKKKPPRKAVFLEFAGTRFCFYVYRPLLHRLWVGIAKVKMAGKEEAGHERVSVWCLNDYNAIVRGLASSLWL
ncbi:hypothetical protein [Duganella vulcania]|uniref:Uncharacterized protein n=1 Tax=Duganella vulcania TaxID=2692166 RepID=A0A845GRX1_9BURK|nr:hypothetical protein [Duganella vulcania]MYM96170.1 hypothetical protein [Duganella vulcania]